MSDDTASNLPFDEKRCVVFLVQEENKKGPGVLYVVDDSWEYLPLDDPHWDTLPPTFSSQLSQQVEDDRNQHFFIVVRRPTSLYVTKYARQRAAIKYMEYCAGTE